MTSAVRAGEKLCRDIRSRLMRDDQEYLVFLFSRDEEINRQTVRFLPVWRRKECVSRILLVTDDPRRERMIRETIRVPYELDFCTKEEAHAIGRYCTEITRGRRHADRILINGTDDEEEYRYQGLIGVNGIDTADITAMSVFDLGYVPDQAEIEGAVRLFTEQEDFEKALPKVFPSRDPGNIPPDANEVWETEIVDLQAWERCLAEGRKEYDAIRAEFPDTRIYLCTYHGTGDMYLVGLYLRDRMKHDHVSDCVLVVASEGSRKLMGLLDLDDVIRKIVVLPGRPACNRLLYYVRDLGFKAANTGLFSNDYGIMRLERLSGVKGIDFNTLFQKAIFFSDVKRTGADLRIENADAFFESEGIRPGRTVLLAPHAATTERMSEKIWGEIAHRLKERGYDVVTNVSGMTERPVAGTRGISIPYAMIVDFLDKAGGFIGLRSGLCDIISGSTANKVILYPSGVSFHFSTSLNYFSLEKMYNIHDHLTEIEISEDHMEEIPDRITTLFPG